MMDGVCSLCQKRGRLLDSHFMPKSVYRVISQGFPDAGQGMVWVSGRDKSAAYTSKQAKKHLLCSGCESRFSKFGEDIVLPFMARRTGFPLATKIKKFKRFAAYNGEIWYFPSNDKIAYSFMYFVVSMAWRMSITEWDSYGMPKTYGTIRQHYMDYLSSYLLGRNNENNSINLYLTVYVDNQHVDMPMMGFPTVKNHDSYQHIVFNIPGIKFSLVVGDLSGTGVKEIYSLNDDRVFFVSRNLKSHPDFQYLIKFLQKEVSSKGRLLKEQRNV
ncbi:hypothetical protein [Vibrio navarrensis]|uniref:hypothetical protein n=1 Tax=Vibrio navarrensis TaxID=29495 RepID=UPI001D04692E|nr:hypothetical protein [Vibrio navarrensis]